MPDKSRACHQQKQGECDVSAQGSGDHQLDRQKAYSEESQFLLGGYDPPRLAYATPLLGLLVHGTPIR